MFAKKRANVNTWILVKILCIFKQLATKVRCIFYTLQITKLLKTNNDFTANCNRCSTIKVFLKLMHLEICWYNNKNWNFMISEQFCTLRRPARLSRQHCVWLFIFRNETKKYFKYVQDLIETRLLLRTSVTNSP